MNTSTKVQNIIHTNSCIFHRNYVNKCAFPACFVSFLR